MHLEIQGQWWSYSRMQTSHLLQWCMFLSIFIWHFLQNLYKQSITFLFIKILIQPFTLMPSFIAKLLLGLKAPPINRKVVELLPLLHLVPLPIVFKMLHLRKK